MGDLKLNKRGLHVSLCARSLLHLVDTVTLPLDELATLIFLGIGGILRLGIVDIENLVQRQQVLQLVWRLLLCRFRHYLLLLVLLLSQVELSGMR